MILYKIKKAFRRFLKSIHNFILLFGVDISFVKKKVIDSAIEHNTLEGTNKTYSSKEYQAQIFSEEHQVFFRKIVELLVERGIDPDHKQIADVGCGIGNLLMHINKLYPSAILHGYDFSPKALEIAVKRLSSATFHEHNIYDSLENTYDIIFCTEVLEHLINPEDALKNLMSAIKPGGYILLTVPNGRIDDFEGHINFWSPESWNIFVQKQAQEYKVETGYIHERNLFALIFIQ